MLNAFLKHFRPSKIEHKASKAGAAIAFYAGGQPLWTPRDYEALAREGFQRNPIVHRAVRLIAEAAACLPLTLMDRSQELTEHPLLTLLARPNPRQSGASLMESLYGHLMVSGNAYLEAVSLDNIPRELYALRPDRMQVVPGRNGWPVFYEYQVGESVVRYSQDVPLPPILHLTLFHPSDDYYGLSPMEAAATSLDIHNAAGAWNKSLLDNAARPSGALIYQGGQGNLSDDQFERLKAELESNYQGVAHAGRPLLLEGGLDWRALSLSPKDMDFVEAKAAAARDIALAFGVPPLLLGIQGDNTHANYGEANRAFYRQTIIPLVKRTADSIAHWLGAVYGNGLRLTPDLDAIEALAVERELLWRRVNDAAFLTDDEKREAVGYGMHQGKLKP